jgi:hypothetical protein
MFVDVIRSLSNTYFHWAKVGSTLGSAIERDVFHRTSNRRYLSNFFSPELVAVFV